MKTILTFLFIFVNAVAILYKPPAVYSLKKENTKSKADSLMKLLPEKLVTIVDKTLDDQFAQIETVVTRLPDMNRKMVFLITLPLENYLEDIYFSANQSAVIYPRIVFNVIVKAVREGKSKKEVARKLVKLQKENAFEKIYKLESKKQHAGKRNRENK